MGLDSFFYTQNSEGKNEPFTDDRLEGINLTGGMLSGNGADGSFRGKIYDHFLNTITDGAFTLYEEEQGSENYPVVITALVAWLSTNPGGEGWNPAETEYGIYPHTRKDIEGLLQLFTVAYDRGAMLHGWW